MSHARSLWHRLRNSVARLVGDSPRDSQSARRRRSHRSALEKLEKREVFATAVGMNIDRIIDYSPAWVFNDAFQSSRSWVSYSFNTSTGAFSQSPPGTAVSVDSHGWPTQLNQWRNDQGQLIQQRLGTGVFNAIDGHYPAGTYRAEWQGDATLVWAGDARVAQTGVDADGTHFALLDVRPTRAGIQLRVDAMSSTNPLRDVHIWMPDDQGESLVREPWSVGADFSPFHPLFRERLDPFATIRTMQAARTNSTDEVHWSDRRTLDDARQSTAATDFQNGLAPEYIVELSNETHSNAWLTMPYLADDDYIRNYATLVRDQLDPNLKVYVEWSNEVWNFSPGYESHPWVRDQVGLPTTDPNFWPTFYQIVARETRRDFDIWSEVFAGQEDRLVRVVSGQAANPWVARQITQHMGGHFDAIACDGYVTFAQAQLASFNASTTTDQVVSALFNDALPHTLDFLRQHEALAEQYAASLGRDIQLLVYEGGVLLPGTGRPYEQAFLNASRDPRMYDLYQQLLHGADQAGVDLFTAFTFTDTSPFADASHLRTMDQPLADAHKYRSLVDYLVANPPPEEHENEAPVNATPSAQTIAAGTPLVFSLAAGNSIQVSDADAGDAAIQVTLSTANGILRLAAATGLASVAGDGTGTITATGTTTALNRALDGLTFTPAAGVRTAVVRVATDDLGNTGRGGARQDVDDVAIEVVAPAHVRSVVINDGAAQRSMVRSVTVTFDQPVRLDAGAFLLERQDGRSMLLAYAPGVYTSLTLSFAGTLAGAGGSLADGSYRLTIFGSRVHELRLNQELDGDGDGRGGGNRQDSFFRLFGDSDGDRDVDMADARAMKATLGKRRGQIGFLDYFDFNGGGVINGADTNEFARRYRPGPVR